MTGSGHLLTSRLSIRSGQSVFSIPDIHTLHSINLSVRSSSSCEMLRPNAGWVCASAMLTQFQTKEPKQLAFRRRNKLPTIRMFCSHQPFPVLCDAKIVFAYLIARKLICIKSPASAFASVSNAVNCRKENFN